jgi:hypothetical protein
MWHQAAIGDQRDGSALHGFDRWRRWHLGEMGQGNFATEAAPSKLVQEKRRGALRGIALDDGVVSEPPGKIPFAGRGAERFMSYQLKPEGDHTSHLVEHTPRLSAGLHDVDLATIQVDAGVFRMHASDRWHP